MLILTGAGILFGWAKPVPVDPNHMRVPRRDMMLVAAAGPSANMVIAFISAILLHVAPYFPGQIAVWAEATLWNSILLNIVLAVFNMIPLPPLDGGKVAVGMLPREQAMKLESLERFGFLIVLGVFFLLPSLTEKVGVNLPVARMADMGAGGRADRFAVLCHREPVVAGKRDDRRRRYRQYSPGPVRGRPAPVTV